MELSTDKAPLETEVRILDNLLGEEKFKPAEVTGSLKELVQELHCLLGETGISGLDQAALSKLKRLVFDAQLAEEEWRPFVFYKTERYARNLVDQGNGNFDLLLVSWLPQQSSCIHDHAGSHCLMKVLEGQIEESLYAAKNDEGPLELKRSTLLQAKESTYIHDKIGLHRIFNPSREKPAVSLHLYSPPIMKCHSFDESTSKAVFSECGIDSCMGVPVDQRPPL